MWSQKKGNLSKATFHHDEEPASFNYNVEKTREPMESQTHSMVLVDSPDNSPAAPRKEYETQSDSLKFNEELPEWESMDIQLRIDPSGKQEPVITRREKPKDDDNDSLPSDGKLWLYIKVCSKSMWTLLSYQVRTRQEQLLYTTK